MTEQSTEAPKLPAWYDPQRPLIMLADGPRAGTWSYADRWADEQRLAKRNPSAGDTIAGYVATTEKVAHRLHAAILGTVWRWHAAPVTPAAHERDDADAPTWLDKDKL